MNCCDDYGKCTQGRNCPVRVAHIGKKMHGPEPIKNPPTLRRLAKAAKWVLVWFAVWVVYVACLIFILWM